jgi:hypothetical protein
MQLVRQYTFRKPLTVEYRWAEDHAERLPAMVADLVRRPSQRQLDTYRTTEKTA